MRWYFSYGVPYTDARGMTVYWFEQGKGRDEQDARAWARMQSRRYGHANVTNREGHVATYVGGKEQFFRK